MISIVPLLSILFVGVIGFGGWPLLANFSTLKDPFVRGFLVNAAVTAAFIPFLAGRIGMSEVASTGGVILIVAGLVNFLGHVLFAKLQVTQGSQISVYAVMIPALAVLTSAIGGPILFGDSVTLSKIGFMILIVVGIAGLAFTSIK